MRSARLLIVEDEADLRANLRQGLNEAGFATTCTGSAESAEKAVAAEGFDEARTNVRCVTG